MALARFEKDMAIISALDDEPNDVGGLTAAELKSKFDEGGKAIKQFLNETLTPQIDSEKAGRDELEGLVLGQIPDGTITVEKMAPSFFTSILTPQIQVTYNGVLQTKVNRKNEKSSAKFTRPKKGITKQAGEESHRQPG